MKDHDENLAEIRQRRREVEASLETLRTAMARETGLAPRRRGWLTLLVAGAAGLTGAMRRRGRGDALEP
ncbi:MAG TPA: hypothetical protein VHQ65_11120 [Thermoanaerobaculia bacterium]|nr:hypothetical protein [Thermoanaerobaculia bacterium]